MMALPAQIMNASKFKLHVVILLLNLVKSVIMEDFWDVLTVWFQRDTLVLLHLYLLPFAHEMLLVVMDNFFLPMINNAMMEILAMVMDAVHNAKFKKVMNVQVGVLEELQFVIKLFFLDVVMEY